MPAPVSVIVPTYNAAADLVPMLASLTPGLSDGLVHELIVTDGGSGDATLSIADAAGAKVVSGAPGRGGQLRRGVAMAAGDWLLILHADTHLSPDWAGTVRDHLSGGRDHAGYFRLRFRASGLAPRLVARGGNLRARLLGLPYGDQGLLISRTLYDAVGGYPDLPLMEDVTLARALKGRLRPLDADAITGADRYQARGWARQVLANQWRMLRWSLGIPAERLARGYAPPPFCD